MTVFPRVVLKWRTALKQHSPWCECLVVVLGSVITHVDFPCMGAKKRAKTYFKLTGKFLSVIAALRVRWELDVLVHPITLSYAISAYLASFVSTTLTFIFSLHASVFIFLWQLEAHFVCVQKTFCSRGHCSDSFHGLCLWFTISQNSSAQHKRQTWKHKWSCCLYIRSQVCFFFFFTVTCFTKKDCTHIHFCPSFFLCFFWTT